MAQARHAASVAVATSAPPIDLVQLATSTMGNRDLELQILHMFRAQSCDMLARIKQETDPAIRKDLAHTLKGSARAVGAAGVAQACEALETAIGAGQDPSTDVLASAVDEAASFIGDLVS